MSTLRVSRVKTRDDVVWVVFLCCGALSLAKGARSSGQRQGRAGPTARAVPRCDAVGREVIFSRGSSLRLKESGRALLWRFMPAVIGTLGT